MLTLLKALRLQQGWNQDEVAAKLKMSRPWFSLLENGRLKPTDVIKERLEQVFGKTADELLKETKVK